MQDVNGTSKMSKNGSRWKTVTMNLAGKKKEEESPVLKKVLHISKDKGKTLNGEKSIDGHYYDPLVIFSIKIIRPGKYYHHTCFCGHALVFALLCSSLKGIGAGASIWCILGGRDHREVVLHLLLAGDTA